MSDKNNGFKVEAQGYGVGNRIKEYLHPSGLRRAVTESVSPKYQERMETLRDADKSIRETANNLKDYLKNAQKAFRDNRYLDVAHWCAQIDGIVRSMVQEGKPVVDLRDAEIAEFYTRYEDAEPNHDYFAADDGLISTAGILDSLFGNSIEKLYWKKVKESKLAVQSLVKRAEKLIAIVLSCLGRMGDARAKGNISVWIEELQRIAKSQSEFQIFARGIYDKHLRQLAEMVRANKSKNQLNQQNVPKTYQMPEANKANEAEELVEIPVEEKEEIYNKKPESNLPKREPGRPTVDEAAKKKEMEQIEQLQSLLNNPIQPAEKTIETPIAEIPKEEIKPVDTTKVEPVKVPTVETPKAVQAPITQVDQPKVNPVISKPPVASTPVSKPVSPPVPTAPVVKVPAVPAIQQNVAPGTEEKRGRGRPRKYPPGQSPTDIKNRERQERKNQLNKIVNPETPVETNVPESLTSPFESTAPVIPSVTKSPAPALAPTSKPSAPKSDEKMINRLRNQLTAPSDEDIEKVDLHKSTIEKPSEGSDKKMTMVLLPKIKPDNLDKIQARLEKELGHPVKFVTMTNGKQIAQDFIDAGWDVQGMDYKEAEAIEKKYNKSPLEMLDDQEFLNSLPRLSNGFFDKGKILNDDGTSIQGNKVVTVESKYPEFQNLDEKTRKAVIDKLNDLQEKPENLIIPVKKEKKNELESVVPKDAPKNISEIKPNIVEKPVKNTLEDELKDIPLDEEEDMKIFEHGNLLEKLLDKPISELTEIDVRKLQFKPEYYNSLPRLKNNKLDMNLIRKFPEMKILEDDPRFLKQFLKDIEKSDSIGKVNQNYKDPKAKSATVDEAVIKYAHQKFFNELQKVANAEDYGLMAAMMCAYSEKIENFDPVTSIKLLQAAEKLV